jgi:hypothetical protein
MAHSKHVERYPIKTGDTSHRVINREAILVNFQNSFFTISIRSGLLFGTQHTLSQVAASLVAEYEVTLENALQDCRKFVEQLVEQGLLQWRSDPEVRHEDAAERESGD